jgi:DNA replication and repair protein RecF
MIAPDDLELINEGSELRRKWVDSILCQVDKTYFEYLIRYQKVILQRNAWLKNEADKPTGQFYALEYYNQQLAESGDYMYHRRQMFTTQFLPLLTRYYSRLSGDQEQVQILYNSDLHECSLLQWLDNSLQHDLRLQRTARGVHKDDFIFLINEQPLRHFGSQGQKKSFLFALKLAQYEFIAKNLQQTPILLLDDVFEKLDQQRMESLIAIISDEHFGQVILTDTHAGRVAAAFHDGVAVQHLAIG